MWPWRIATAWPSCIATTSAAPVDSTSGDLMNTPGKRFPSRPATSTAASKLSIWRPYPLRRTEMSSRPRPRWPAIPSVTSRARTIIPAHVASVGRPAAIALRNGSSRPTRSISIVIVVLSPPGNTRPSRSRRSSGVFTSRVFAPEASSARTCSANAPCIARTPIKGAPMRPADARRLPASGSEQLVLRDGGNLEPRHRLPETGGNLRQHFWLVEVGCGRHDRFGTLQGVLGLEDARADEHTVHAELHHQRSVRRCRNATRGEVDDGQATKTLAFGQQLDRRPDLLGFMHQLGVAQPVKLPNPCVDGPGMSNGFDHVAGSGFTLGANHRGAFGDSAQRLTEIATTADERNLERVLVDVVLLVGGCEHLGLVDVVDPQGLEDLRLDEVADPAFRHDRDRDRLHDRADQSRIGHPRHAALSADVGRHGVQGLPPRLKSSDG